MMVVFLLMVLFFGAYAQECNFCDSSCGDWSCITNCSNPSSGLTFNTYRCAVDSNGNGQIDSCAELPACSNVNGRYVCPVDVNDSLCTSSEWKEPIYYDPDPNNFESNWWAVFVSSANWTYSEYEQKLSQYNLSCVQAPSNSSDLLYRYLASNNLFPVWTCGGVLYADVWFSYNSCNYVSFDGSQWKVKGNDCFNPDKVWQKIGQTGVVEERKNNLPVKAIGLDQSGNRCRKCDTTLSGLTGGLEKSLSESGESEVVFCEDARLFPGRRKTCRAGGATVIGASCCDMAGWFSGMCSQEEKELKKLREAELCVLVGSYCSKRVRFIGCVERKKSFCCFNSSLARIFHECGRPQVGRYFGDPKNPDCKGFTPEEFSRIDFYTNECQVLLEEYVRRMLDRLNLEAKAEEALRRVQGWINFQMENILNREPSRGN